MHQIKLFKFSVKSKDMSVAHTIKFRLLRTS